MKILFVTNQFPSRKYPYKGVFIKSQIATLKKYKIKPYVITPNYGREKNSELIEDIQIFRFKTFTQVTDDPLLRKLFRGIKGLLSLVFFIINQVISIIKITKKEKIKVIHAHWVLPSGFSSFIAAKLLRKKLIITSHGSDLTFCGKSDYFISVSEKIENLAKNYCKKITKNSVIYIGIPSDILTNIKNNNIKKKTSTQYSLVFAGSLYEVKGISYLLEAINILSKKRNDFILNLIGSGENIKEYLKYIKEQNLSKLVKIHGFLDHENTIKIISNSDIAIQSSLNEGLSIFVQESISLGKPIVATDVGGTSEIVKDGYNGFLIKPREPKILAEKLDLLLSNQNLIKKFSENSQKIAKQKLVQEKNAMKIVEIYKLLSKD